MKSVFNQLTEVKYNTCLCTCMQTFQTVTMSELFVCRRCLFANNWIPLNVTICVWKQMFAAHSEEMTNWLKTYTCIRYSQLHFQRHLKVLYPLSLLCCVYYVFLQRGLIQVLQTVYPVRTRTGVLSKGTPLRSLILNRRSCMFNQI